MAVANQEGQTKAVAFIEFSECVSGENKVTATDRNGTPFCNFTLFVERKGFVTEEKYDTATLKDQCAHLSERYEEYTPIVKTPFGFHIPAAMFTQFARTPTSKETHYRDQLMSLAKSRYGKRKVMTPAMYAECLSTLAHFTLDAKELDPSDMVEAVYSHLYLPATYMFGCECVPTMVHFVKKDGTPHVAVSLYDDVTHKNYLVDFEWTPPEPIKGEMPAPVGLREFKNPPYDRVTFQYSSHGMRRVDMPFEEWWKGGCSTRFKPFLPMDKIVLNNAYALYSEIGETNAAIRSIKTSGGASGKPLRRFAKKGLGRYLSGCRSLLVSMEKDGEMYEWSEYIVFE